VATGDTSDFVRRLRAALPNRWFPDDAPVLVGLLTGFAAIWSSLYDLLQYVVLNSRIATARGVFLDIVATDFFAGRITRKLSEPDGHFRTRILLEILRPRATRASVDQALFDLTGQHPLIFEPSLASDTGGYNVGGVGYNVGGGYGSLQLPFQAFITAFRPAGGGISNVSGYGNIEVGIETTGGLGGYGQGAIEWADMAMLQGAITDEDIYAVVAATMPAATIGWTRGLTAIQETTVQVLRPVSAFSRAVSSAGSTLSLVAGVLLSASGRTAGLGRLRVFAATAQALLASGAGLTLGRMTPQSGILSARGLAAGRSPAARLSGAGLLSARGRGASVRGGSSVTAVMTLNASTSSTRAYGRQLYGAVIVLGGRATAMGLGGASIIGRAALTTLGRSKASGVTTVATAGGLSLPARGRGIGNGRFASASLVAAPRAGSVAVGHGRAVMTIVQAAPTAPTNLVASNATANTMTLTWTPSTGAP
jgi:hypothetical protein